MAGTAGTVPGNPSCDRCRTRKVRCQPLLATDLPEARARGMGDRCKGCYNANKPCTHDYVHKKPGRPLGSGGSTKRPRAERGTSSGRSATPKAGPSGLSSPPLDDLSIPGTNLSFLGDQTNNLLGGVDGNASNPGPAFGSIFGSARNMLYPTYSFPPMGLFEQQNNQALPQLPDLTIGLDQMLGASGAAPANNSWTSPVDGVGSGNGLLPPQSGTPDSSHTSDPRSARSFERPLEFGTGKGYEQGRDIEDVLPWSDVLFFIQLYLKHQHCLAPLVHRPTFAQDMLGRRDKGDEAFRGLLCSMIAYAICQCPISTMTCCYERPRLVTILHRCTKAAESIRLRQRLCPSLMLLASTILDWITAQAIGNPHVCDLHIAETTRLAHALNLADPHPRVGHNVVELQLCRRLFWCVYSKDKTEALSGRPIILHDFEGLPPLPIEVDDDYITTEGFLPQPERRTSYMVGFVAIMRIFQVISQCTTRHRAFANHAASQVGDAVLNDMEGDSALLIRWIEQAQSRVRDILDNLPPSLCIEIENLDQHVPPSGDNSLFGIQQANIAITALCADFALLDFRASLCPEEDTRAQREEMARRAYVAMSTIPIEFLSSNGESMRGKVLRIILTLLSMTSDPSTFSQNIWDWWNMYSRVQFLQVIPDETMVLIDQSQSKASPAATAAASSVAAART